MKSRLLLILSICLLAARSFATVHTVQVSSYKFSDSTMTIALGDTVMWQYVSGSGHTTATDAALIPAGAAIWNQPMNSSNPTFMYKPTVAGTYHYYCEAHRDMGMTGTFIVTAATSVEAVSTAPLFSMYPNPAATMLHLQLVRATPVTVTITDLSGMVVATKNYSNTKDAGVNIASLPNGTYTVRAQQDGNSYVQKLTVAH